MEQQNDEETKKKNKKKNFVIYAYHSLICDNA